MKNLHPDDEGLYQRAVELANRLAAHIGKTVIVEPKRRPLADGTDGLCYYWKGIISIKFRAKDRVEDGGKWWPNPLTWNRIAVVVAHEVAHLIHHNHGAEFKRLEQELIAMI